MWMSLADIMFSERNQTQTMTQFVWSSRTAKAIYDDRRKTSGKKRLVNAAVKNSVENHDLGNYQKVERLSKYFEPWFPSI